MEEFPAIGGPAFGIGDAGVGHMPIHSFPYNIVVDSVPDPREVVVWQSLTSADDPATLRDD